jgi:hypothetical protein
MTSPAIQEAARIVERIRALAATPESGDAFNCGGCRSGIVFSEFDVCLNCRGEGDLRSKYEPSITDYARN